MIFCKYWRSFSAGAKREYRLNSKYGRTTDILAMDDSHSLGGEVLKK